MVEHKVSKITLCRYCNSSRLAIAYLEFFKGTQVEKVEVYVCVDCGRVIFPPSAIKQLGMDVMVL